VREYRGPAIGAVADEESLTDMVWANAERFPDAVALRHRVDGSWIDVTTADFAARIGAVAKGLIGAGLRPGDRVALLSRTRYEWTLIDFAIWAAGCVTVAVDESSSADEVAWILGDSGARAVVVETDAHRRVVRSVVDRLAEMVKVWQIDATGNLTPAVDELTTLGADVADHDATERRLAVRASDTATLVYASGTDGKPKGVDLTHRNLLTQIRADIAAFPELMRPANAMLIFLPLAHMFARTLALCCVYSRTTLGHLPGVRDLVADLATFRPTFVVAVPKVFEQVYDTAKQKAHADGRGRFFDIAEDLAVEYSTALDGVGPSLASKVRRAAASKIIYSKVRAVLGGRCVAAISGTGPLDGRLAHFFRGVGVPVYEGYGLTETSAAVCVNTRESFRVGTVGRPVAGAVVRIADDGEILVGGELVFRGYWGNPAATAEALDDGWLRTGDLGTLDPDGYLTLTASKLRFPIRSRVITSEH
jgi:long-chain acyl-CoA synthetase